MSDQKDRLKEALKARSDEGFYFAEREQQLIAKLRRELSARQVEDIKEFALDRCPRCVKNLAQQEKLGMTLELCPDGHGVWFDGALDGLAPRERASWISQIFFGRGRKDEASEEHRKKLGEKLRGELTATQVSEIREIAVGRCPRCLKKLATEKQLDVRIDRCPDGHGTWFDDSEFETFARRQHDSWVSHILPHPTL